MALAYSSVPEKDFSNGIDARSAESQIAPGFVHDLLNADIVETRVRKRKGYQGHAGNLPLRVFQLDYEDAANANQMCFTFDTSISLEQVRSSPIIVYGRTSSTATGTGPITTTDSIHYYSEFTIPLRKLFSAPSGTLVVPGEEHAQGTTNMFVNVVESTSLVNRDYSLLIPDAIRISETPPFDISIDYTTFANRNVFVYYKNRDTTTGESYVHAALAVPVGTTAISIPAATHALANFNIIAQTQQDTGSERLIVEADSIEISNTGDVTVTITNDTGAPRDYYILLSAAPVSNAVTGTVPATSTGTVTITGVSSPWIFYGIYLEQTPGGTKEVVYPDTIAFDDAASTVILTFTNDQIVARQFIVFYEYGETRSNQLCVTDPAVTASGIDERPQVTIWGLEHTEIYGDGKTDRESWVSHIDSYRRSGEQRLICGLGGNLFRTRTYSEAATQYSYPSLYPSLNARTSTNRVLGPLFWDTGETPGRTRGYITSDSSGDSETNIVLVTAVEYDTLNDWTNYTISLPNMGIFDSTGTPTVVGSVISTTTNLEDYLRIDGMSYSQHNGMFRIKQVTSGINQINIWVENDINLPDYDDDGVGGQAGIFTDQFVWSNTAPFVLGDTLLSSAFNDQFICDVLSSSGTTTVSDGLVDRLEVAPGVLFLGRRQSAIIPMRNGYPTATSSVLNVVRGDMLSYSGEDELNSLPTVERLLRVLYVNPDISRTVDITVASGIATVTLTSGDTDALSVGQSVVLHQAGVYSGIQIITALGADTFTFTTTETDSVSGALLVGGTIQIDEPLVWEDTAGDTNIFVCEQRWIPIEAPDDSFNLTPSTYIRHLDTDAYAAQMFLRSTMVVDNMYFTNSSDEVMKFDGSNIYRAGIIPWQPGLFITQNTAATAKVVVNNRSVAYTTVNNAQGKVQITAADIDTIPVGTSVRIGASTQTYILRAYTTDALNAYAVFDRSLDAAVVATGNISEIATLRYYFRLNAVDVNSNIIASAVTGYQDHVVELTADAAVGLKLVGLPVWDIYDYDRLEVEIYRTKKNTAAPFYRLTTIPMVFQNSQGYVLYTDSFADSDLIELDRVSTALKGSELGTAWSDPLRAKYVTSTGNRLVLGNVRDYPQLDIQIVSDASLSNAELSGDSMLFRRDNTDTGITTDMPTRVRYEWRLMSSAIAVTGLAGIASTSFTVSVVNTAVAGDWVYLSYATTALTGRPLKYSGWWQITSASGAAITINYSDADAIIATGPTVALFATDPTDVPVPLGVDGNMGMVNGDSFDLFDSMRRMSMAVNATMRMVDVTIAGMSEYTPWLTARGGNDASQAGRLIIRQPKTAETSLEIVPTFSGYSLFINSIQRTTLDQVSATTRVYPSRLLVSYSNYPEIFDSPTTILDIDSDSAIDVNSADGQEITGVIPFFGESAFGASQQAGILVVFKTNSIYLVDINQKVAGNNAVQRIETEGLGCTAPYSIAVTKGGIMFANESGIYCLRRSQAIEYIGKYMERNWTERVSLSNLELCQGHHYGVGRAYKLSVPLNTTESYIEDSEVYVYDHTSEANGKLGAWERYDNHAATGWANLGSDAFYASTNGRVFIIRNLGTLDDFRDDSSAIGMVLETRATDFGDSGRRKVLDRVIVDYRTTQNSTGTSLKYAIDMEEEYSDTSPFVVSHPRVLTGLADPVARSVFTVSHSVGRRRCIYFGVQILNSTIDEGIEIPGITYKVGGLADTGILQAADTSIDND